LKYLKTFNHSLKRFREEAKLSEEDIARLCLVDESVVKAWESPDDSLRCYPTIDNLLDICLKVDKPLEFFLDIEKNVNEGQLDLPGIGFAEESDLRKPLEELSQELEKLIPTADEMELLRRFRNSDPESRKLIIQLMNS
jgi:transcriptional regulator with XRE-family HTH domain